MSTLAVCGAQNGCFFAIIARAKALLDRLDSFCAAAVFVQQHH
jgi:hypothetical protein